MAADTFRDAWNLALLHLPDVPPLLVRSWVQQAYKKIADDRNWAFQRVEAAITVQVARSLTVGVTIASATITSAAGFVAGDAGRQFRVGTYPVYTIITVTDASHATLDRAYGETSNAAATGQILDAYFTAPDDFKQFHIVTDPYNQRPIGWWFTDDELARFDPNRTGSDSGIRALCSRKLSGYAATLGRVQYEYWPYPTSARSYPYIYFKGSASLVNTDPLPFPLNDRADLLKDGAVMLAAGWPGSSAKPNPYFNLQNHRLLKEMFEQDVQRLQLQDDSVALTDLTTVHWELESLRTLSYDSTLLRRSDGTLSDYY